MTSSEISAQPEIVRGIPEHKWMSPKLMDEARMTDKQRLAYFMQICRAEIELLMKIGNLVGEKPSRSLDLMKCVGEREAAFQRAMHEQLTIYND